MNIFLRTLLFLLLFFGFIGTTFAMFRPSKAFLSRAKRMNSPRNRTYTTPPTIGPTTSWLDGLKNWFFKPTIQSLPRQHLQTIDPSLAPTSESVTISKQFTLDAQPENLNNISISEKQALESALNITKKKLKNYYLKRYNMKLPGIVCLPPGKEILFLLEAESLTEMENLLKNKKEQIIQSFGFSADELKNMHDIIDTGINKLNTLYKTPKINPYHDTKNLSPEDLEEIKNLLTKVGIEPSSLAIVTDPNAYKNTASCEAIYIESPAFKQTTAALTFSKNIDPSVKPFLIAHEIGHLIRNHCMQFAAIDICLKKKFKNKTKPADILNNILNLQALFEIEADIYVAMNFPDIAKTIYTALLQASSLTNLPFIKPSEIYINNYNRLHLLNKIIDLHAEKALKDKPSIADATRE